MLTPDSASSRRATFRHFLVLLAVVLAGSGLVSCGPRTSEQARVQETQVPVAGTHVLLAPPDGFVAAPNFAGFQHVAGEAGIMVTDLAGTDYYASAEAFSRERLEAKGLAVLAYQDTLVGDYLAKYAYLQSTPTTRTHQLTFGDSTFVATVAGLFPAADEALGRQLKTALFSSSYNKKALIDPAATATFTVDEQASKFRFASFAGNMYAYVPGGKATPVPGDDAVVVVVPVPTQNEKAADFSAQLKSQLDAAGLRHRTVKNESTQPLNGYDAYEAEVYGDLAGVPTLTYVLYLVHGTQGLFVRGTAPNHHPENLAEFKKFAHTLRFR